MAQAKTPAGKAGSAAVDAYVARVPAAARGHLVALRKAILAGARGGEESISYGIPAVKVGGRAFLYCAAWKAHVSLYPMSPGMRAALGVAADDFVMAKGTIRFPLDEPLPMAIVQKLVKTRAAEMRGERAKPAARKRAAGKKVASGKEAPRARRGR